MTIQTLISALRASPPQTEQDAQAFLAPLSTADQLGVIAAVYLGREHLHHQQLRPDVVMSRRYIDHIPSADFARILFEKKDNLILYLDALTRCAGASGFDLATL